MWYNFHRGSRQSFIHYHLLLWTQVKFTVKYATSTSNTNANSVSGTVTLRTDFHILRLSESIRSLLWYEIQIQLHWLNLMAQYIVVFLWSPKEEPTKVSVASDFIELVQRTSYRHIWHQFPSTRHCLPSSWTLLHQHQYRQVPRL